MKQSLIGFAIFIFAQVSVGFGPQEYTSAEPRTVEEAIARCQGSGSVSDVIACEAAARETFKNSNLPTCSPGTQDCNVSFKNYKRSRKPASQPPPDKPFRDSISGSGVSQ